MESFLFETTNISSDSASIFLDNDLSATLILDGGLGLTRAASAASFCSSMRAATEDSRSGMEFSRLLRDSKVSMWRDSRD